MTSYLLFGSAGLGMEDLRDRVGAALRLDFVEHDSSFWNGTYFRAVGEADEEVCVYDNVRRDDHDEVPFLEYQDVVTAVTVSGTARPEEVERVVTSIGDLRLLRQSEPGAPAPGGRRPMVYDTYGSPSRDLHELRPVLGGALGIDFAARSDDVAGSDYYAADGPDGEGLRIVDNRVSLHGKPYQPDFPEMVTILDVDDTRRSDEIARRLDAVEGLVRLRHEEI